MQASGGGGHSLSPSSSTAPPCIAIAQPRLARTLARLQLTPLMHRIRCCFLSCISWSTALLALARSRCEKRSGVGSHGPALQPGAELLAPVDCHCLQDLMRSTPSHGAAGNLHFACVRLSSLALPPKLLAEPCPAQVPSTSPWPWVGNWAPSQHCSVLPALLALPCTRSLFCSFGSNETQMGLAIGPAQRTVQP